MNDKTSKYPQAHCRLYIKILNSSNASIWNLFVAGAQTFPNISSWWVDVRDVANAHIQAYEIPEASGRYCLVERDLHNSEILKILRKLYPGLPLPEKFLFVTASAR